jgi:protein CpxP
MNTIRKNILIGLAVLSIGGTSLAVQAQDSRAATTAASTVTKEQRQAKWAERKAQRQQKLREQLKLTPSQDAAFSAYMAARQPVRSGQKVDRDAWKTMAAPERMALRLERSKARLASMESQLAALKSVYAVLTSEQQKVFDEASTRRGWGHGGRGHRGHGMGHKGGRAMHG